MYDLFFTEEARRQFDDLQADHGREKRLRAVRKCLRILAENPRHPGLNTHAWKGKKCPHDDTLWEAYAENNTPGAYRVFFCYPPTPDDKAAASDPKAPKANPKMLIVAITPHP